MPIADLETRLSELLGDQADARSGLGAPRDHAAIQEQILTLQAEVHELRGALTERGEELDAARQAPTTQPTARRGATRCWRNRSVQHLSGTATVPQALAQNSSDSITSAEAEQNSWSDRLRVGSGAGRRQRRS
jgi:hypothetical protein